MKLMEIEHDERSGLGGNLGGQTTDADSSTKSDPKDMNSGLKPDSLANAIASARKELFKMRSPADYEDDAITVATSMSRK